MANLAKLEFVALDISGENYLSWILDAEMHLNAQGLGDTITSDSTSDDILTIQVSTSDTQKKAKALIFLRHHLHESLKSEYLTIKDPYILWTKLQERFDHQKLVFLPAARSDWINLRLQDYKSVQEYNSALFKISSQLILCGEKITDIEMLEKTFSTFHPTNVLLMQQYRERQFKTYGELITCLLVAEKNNELLMKNFQTRPTGSAALPEVHVTNFQGSRRGRGRGRGYGRGRFHNQYRPHNNSNAASHPKWQNSHQKWQDTRSSKGKETTPFEGASREKRGNCHRCGIGGHWSRTCRTAKHLVNLYQASLKGKKVETNLAIPHLDVTDFPENSSGGTKNGDPQDNEWWSELYNPDTDY